MRATATRSGARRRARELALAILFQADIGGVSPGEAIGATPETLRMMATEWAMDPEEFRKLEPEIEEFGMRLADTYFRHAALIDKHISALSHEWAIDRMPAIDRNILRMAAAELLYFPDVPDSAAINEAVELAKDYGTVESGKFVNGILGALARQEGLAGAPSE